ncbi:MAG TPA: tyrosine-type recombinase/integrase [Verrucomicrobiota bacterium]|nr:tyrosine-type recombinase/integrase [Verrucomicrobiota bacterium]
MKKRYRKFLRGRTWWVQDSQPQENGKAGKQVSLGTKDRAEAERLLASMNEPYRFAAYNLQMARTHLQMSNPEINRRTWQQVMDAVVKTKHGKTKARYETAVKDKAFDAIRTAVAIETTADTLLDVMAKGTVCTNVYLRRWHNFAVDMSWLLVPLIPKNRWPAVKHAEKRGITLDEHQRIIAREQNPERKAFYEICWHVGGSQSDMAMLKAENIDWQNRTLNFVRQKTQEPVHLMIGPELEKLLRSLPQSGLLFPYLAGVRECDRATEFRQRCQGLGISGVTLHSYRYAWAERARAAGYPERNAQEALGHNSKAVHRAYAKRARVTLPSLEDYEKQMREKIVLFQSQPAVAA